MYSRSCLLLTRNARLMPNTDWLSKQTTYSKQRNAMQSCIVSIIERILATPSVISRLHPNQNFFEKALQEACDFPAHAHLAPLVPLIQLLEVLCDAPD